MWPESGVGRVDLILWRHAEAVSEGGGGGDLARRLTARGEKQAVRMADWLERHIPDSTRVLCSPAVRAEQTALALGRKVKRFEPLLPDADPAALLEAIHWPQAKGALLLVGHQPQLGAIVVRLLGMEGPVCSVRKGAVWWLRHREREGRAETVLLTVQTPDLL